MPTETCILTTKDFTILEVMRERCLGRDDPLAPILKRKIESALVVFRDDVRVNVATLSSRVAFRVDGREPDTRILSHDRMNGSAGLFLPITTPRGLALLGLAVARTSS
jgi:regulator of nucleoside diphosphate kinase